MGNSIIVACGQEATYKEIDHIRESTLGRLQGVIVGADLIETKSGANTKKDCDPYCKIFLESDFPVKSKDGKAAKFETKKMSHVQTWHIEGENGLPGVCCYAAAIQWSNLIDEPCIESADPPALIL